MNSNSLRFSLTLVKLVDVVGSIGGGNMLVAAGNWGIGIVVWVVCVRSSNIGSSNIGEDRCISLSLTLVELVDIVDSIGGGYMLVAAANWGIGIGWVAIVVAIELSIRSSGSKAKEGNLKFD